MLELGRALEDTDVFVSKSSSWMDPSYISSQVLKWSTSAIALYVAGGAISVWFIRKMVADRARGGGGRYDLSGKVVCVTGATGGLGKCEDLCDRVKSGLLLRNDTRKALCQILAKRGARLIMTGRSPTALKDLTEDLRLHSGASQGKAVEAASVLMDLADADSLPGKAREILAVNGHVDVMIHNAGVSSRGCVLDTKSDVFFQVMQTNYFGPVLLTKELLPAMINKGEGYFVAISSVQGRLAIPNRAPYAASKHALQAFFDSLRAEVQDRNIHILVTSPGYIRTGSSMNALNSEGKAHGKMDDTHKGGMEPEYVAEQIITAIEGRQLEVIVSTRLHKLVVLLRAFWPSFYFFAMLKRGRKERNMS